MFRPVLDSRPGKTKKERASRTNTAKSLKQSTNSNKPIKLVTNSVRPKTPKSVVAKPVITANPASEITVEPTTNKEKPVMHACYRRLFDAVRANDVNTVKCMITTEKLNVNIVDEDDPLQPTPLLVACQHELLDVARELFKAKPKPDVNLANKKGRRPVWCVILSLIFINEENYR